MVIIFEKQHSGGKHPQHNDGLYSCNLFYKVMKLKFMLITAHGNDYANKLFH